MWSNVYAICRTQEFFVTGACAIWLSHMNRSTWSQIWPLWQRTCHMNMWTYIWLLPAATLLMFYAFGHAEQRVSIKQTPTWTLPFIFDIHSYKINPRLSCSLDQSIGPAKHIDYIQNGRKKLPNGTIYILGPLCGPDVLLYVLLVFACYSVHFLYAEPRLVPKRGTFSVSLSWVFTPVYST